MKYLSKTFSSIVFAGFLMLGLSLQAQNDDDNSKSDFDQYEAFSPLFMNDQVNSFHSATGNPGPNYWQNQADYDIKAELDTVENRVTGELTLTYTNNSPYDLNNLWFQLDQNTFRKDSRGSALYPPDDRNGVRTFTDGYEIEEIKVGKKQADYNVTDTRMQVQLPKTLKKDGKDVKVHIKYAFDIPTHGKDRMGRVETKNGTIYTIAQWYPRMAVYDEVEGWNTLPYLGSGEFYLEYGNFDYEITVPENMLVVGSGNLQNPKKVLTKKERKQLKKARKSDETVDIRSKEEMKAGDNYKEGKSGKKTWHFKMDDSRDVSWAASTAFIWDAARINLPDDKSALAQSVYPEENSGNDGYGRSTEYTKNAIEIYSNQWYPYPYDVATNVGGHEGGMEYPGLVFCDYQSKNEALWGVINHEFGHTWFPMMVGSNERKYGWLDEGLNTFMNDLATEKFNDGEYAQDTYLNANMKAMMFNDNIVPLFTRADLIQDQMNLAMAAYMKPATALHVLRDVVLGKDRFDHAFKTYVDRWKYKHPQPWDFFNTLSDVTGEDLGWFFKGWFMKNWTNDQAITDIAYKEDEPEKGAEITLLNKGKMAMPVDLKVTYRDNDTTRVKLPVEIWMKGAEFKYHLDSDKKIKSAEIDPDSKVPDANPMDNTFKKLAEAPEDQSAEKVIAHYLDAVGGKQAISNIKDVSLDKSAEIQGNLVNIKERQKNPDKYLREIEVSGQSMLKILIDGDDISVTNRGREQDLSDEDKEYIKNQQASIFPEMDYEDEGYKTELLGQKTDDEDRTLYVLQITDPEGNVTKTYYDADSGLKVKEKGADGSKTSFSDYKDVNGLKLPYTTTTNQFGGPTGEVEVKVDEAKINSGLQDSAFE